MKVRTIEPNQASIRIAASRILAGGVVAFPTETVYGLGCATFNARAIDLVYRMKGRPASNPLIAHVQDAEMARSLTTGWNSASELLCAAFWPGPLTIVMKRSAHVPASASAGRDTIAIRSPGHSVAQELLSVVNGPISAPSANRSGHLSATTAQHVADDFADVVLDGEQELLILDGGPTAMGIESTVIDLTAKPPRILRPGSITEDQIRRVIGNVAVPEIMSQDASPGTSMRHYAPRVPACLISQKALERGSPLPGALADAARIVVLSHSRPTGDWSAYWLAMPPDPVEYAARLYGCLREAELLDVDAIAIEAPPGDDPAWRAIRDRLRRATAT